jgi:hypothetical protein
MRHIILVGLGICLTQTAAAQTEVIIRRSGQPDQVIQVPDSAHRQRIELRLDSTMHRAFDARTAAATERALKQLDGAIARVRIDSLQSQFLALRVPEMGRMDAQLKQLAAHLIERRQPHFGIAVDYRPRDTDRWGAYVAAVTPGSPAAQAGIMSGDIITRIDGKSIAEKSNGSSQGAQSLPYVRLTTIIAQLQVGKPVAVELRRGTQTHTVHVTPDDDDMMQPSIATGQPLQLEFPTVAPMRGFPMTTMAPRPQTISVFANNDNLDYGFGADGLFANVELAPINEKLGAYFGVNEGVLVVNTNANRTGWVSFDSAPAAAVAQGNVRVYADTISMRTMPGGGDAVGHKAPQPDLQPGDVITGVDGRKVTTPSQLMRVVASYDRGEEFKLQIMRQKHAESIPVKVP